MITTPSFTLTLNEQQRSAVENLTDSILLLAGAGTGKTGSLAARVAFLLGSSVKPEEILCLTFTNRACREMSQRVEATAGPAAQDVTIRTIHSFCAWLLRRAPESLRDFGRDFMVCDEEDALESIRAVVREISGRELDNRAAGILQKFTGLVKERQLTAPQESCRQAVEALFTQNRPAVEAICQTYEHTIDTKFLQFLWKYGASITNLYNRKLRESNLLDFSDLLVNAHRLMCEPEMQSIWSERFHYIHVDEAQDMSLTEYHFLETFCAQAKLMLCGDFNQTIYEWRGSNPEALIQAFQERFSPVTIQFTQNYRCSQQLADLASNYRFHAFRQGYGSRLDPDLPSCQEIIQEDFPDPEEETAWIYRQIEALGLEDLSRCAILTRNNAACKTICELLKLQRLKNGQSGLRFMLADELRLFRRPEVKDALACLRLFLDAFDGESLRRIAVRRCGIGSATLKNILSDCPSVCFTDFLDRRTLGTGDFFGPLLDALDAGKVVVFDVESTGTNPEEDDVIQMAAIRLNPDGTEKERFERFLIPSKPVGDSEKVHGFSDAYLAEHGMEPVIALEAFLDFVSGCTIVGHNVRFDMTITAANLKRHSISRPFENLWYDTLDLSRRFLTKLENHKLSTVAADLKVYTPSHNAMDDILATAGVLIKLTETFLIPSTEQRRGCYKKYSPRFGSLLEKMNALRYNPPVTTSGLIERIDTVFGLSASASPSEQANLLLLRDFTEDFANPALPLPRQAAELLELTALTTGELDRLGKSQNKIPVITIHQSKGCEFDYVFMPMLQEGVFPSYQTLISKNDREERRVFYVSITRAKKGLYLSWSHRNEKGRSCQPSRYLSMLGPNPSLPADRQ